MGSLDSGPSPQLDVTEAKIFVFSNNNTYGTLPMRSTGRPLGKSGPVLHSILQQLDEMKQIHTLVSEFHGQQGWS
jgi:hypothetical protein